MRSMDKTSPNHRPQSSLSQNQQKGKLINKQGSAVTLINLSDHKKTIDLEPSEPPQKIHPFYLNLSKQLHSHMNSSTGDILTPQHIKSLFGDEKQSNQGDPVTAIRRLSVGGVG